MFDVVFPLRGKLDFLYQKSGRTDVAEGCPWLHSGDFHILVFAIFGPEFDLDLISPGLRHL